MSFDIIGAIRQPIKFLVTRIVYSEYMNSYQWIFVSDSDSDFIHHTNAYEVENWFADQKQSTARLISPLEIIINK